MASQEVVEGHNAAEPANTTRAGHVFGGWYADEALSNAWDFDTDTVTANTTLYAKWTQLTLSSSVSDGTIYTGGRIVLTPSVDGGEWDWDKDCFSATFNSPATFTALKAGTSTITYTVENVTTSYDVTIKESELPSTGQNTYVFWALIGVSGILLAAGIFFSLRKHQA